MTIQRKGYDSGMVVDLRMIDCVHSSGEEAKAFPKHKNFVEVPVGKSFVEEVLKKPAAL